MTISNRKEHILPKGKEKEKVKERERENVTSPTP
jgi:hypothetical protein